MKRIICILLVLSTLFSLAACAKTGVETGDNTSAEPGFEFEADKSWSLENEGSKITIALKENIPYITYLGTVSGKQNMLSAESPMFLPENYKLNDKTQEHAWVYTDAEFENNILKLNFEDSAGFVYTIICEANEGLDGPFQISGSFTNNCQSDISYISLKLFNIDLTFPETPTAWTFVKESGCAEGWELYNGTYYEGSGIYKDLLEEKKAVRIFTNPSNGWNSNGYIPMMYLDCNSQCGVYAALEWPDAKIEASGKGENKVSLVLNISEKGTFATKVENGDYLMPFA